MVTMLEVSSASSSLFASRTLLKKLKMELKLIQGVNSCLSVPARHKQKHQSAQDTFVKLHESAAGKRAGVVLQQSPESLRIPNITHGSEM